MTRVVINTEFSNEVLEELHAKNPTRKHSELKFEADTSSSIEYLSIECSCSYVSLYSGLLSTLYPVVLEEPFKLLSPDHFTVRSKSETKVYDSSYSTLSRNTGDELIVALIKEEYHHKCQYSNIKWDPDTFIESVEVPTFDYINTVFEKAQEYATILDENWPDDWKSDFHRISLLLQHARDIVTYIENKDTTAGYIPSSTSEYIQQYLYKSDFSDRRYSWFLTETGLIEEEVERLHDSVNDDMAEAAYGQLLSHESVAIRRAAAKALAQNPDPRAKTWLLGRRWKDDPEVMPAVIHAVTTWRDDDVATALCEILDYSSHEQTRKLAAEELACFEGQEVITTLETVAKSDESEAVREAARQSLKKIRQ